MAVTCTACGAVAAEGARFCSTCGRPLTLSGGDERKLATVLFADLAGSTTLATELDAEALRALLADVYEQFSQVVVSFGGTVEKFIGDALMAVFGVPTSHEDDPERAVRSALAMRSRLTAVARRHGKELGLRVGVNTGVVATGSTPGRDFLVTGDAVNVAARLQQAAEPGEVLVGDRTFRALQPLVRTVQPRSLIVKGRPRAVSAYAVESIAPSTVYRRRRSAGPFVGRLGELSLVTTLCDRAVEHRRPHMITIVGEPGIGKSRLAEEAVIELQSHDQPPQLWVCRCRPYGEGGSFQPLADLLRRSAAVDSSAPADEAREAVTGLLQALLGADCERDVEVILRTAGFDVPVTMDDDEPGAVASLARDGWRQVLVAMAERAPVLLVIEDAQWAEPGLLDLVEDVTSGDLRVPLVALILARDEMLGSRPTWGGRSRNSTLVTLDAIDDSEMLRLAAAISDEAVEGVIDLAGGNPFFLEEILAIRGEGGDMAVPETVHGVIAARLDLLLPEEKRLLQRAAVVGRSFGKEHLLAVGIEEPQRLLAGLSSRDMLQPLGAEWAFKHMLIRDVAYESLVRPERAQLHLDLARWLEQRMDGDRQVVAAHYATAAGLGLSEARADAVRLLLGASFDARRVGAHGLGLRQAERALSLAVDDVERSAAYEAVGDAHWMAERIEKAFEVYDLALSHGLAAGLPPVDRARLRWKWADSPTRWTASRALATSRERIEQEVALGLEDAREAGDEAMEARLLTASALFTWRVETAEEPQERALALADRALEIGERLERPGTTSAARDARTVLLHALNRYDEALENDEARFALLDRIRWREEQMDVCASTARTRQVLGDYAGAVAAVRRAEQLAHRDDPRWLSLPARSLIETYFLMDRWDDALDSYGRFLDVFRRAESGRRQLLGGGVASGAVAGIHVLRGEHEAADRIEQRIGEDIRHGFNLTFAHALLGAGEPSLALDRIAGLKGPRWRIWAIEAEANALLERWDELDEVLGRLRDVPQLERLPRVAAQLDRARAIAGDEFALRRATEMFRSLGCRFEHARCLEIAGQGEQARRVYEELGAEPALCRVR
jgi:class 3 adenylate cyclase/tetratricopeptide (TPR) repeat protein